MKLNYKNLEVTHTDASGMTACSVASPSGACAEHQLQQRVTDALSSTPGGADLDRYFGISSGVPVQPPSEAERGDELMHQLRAAAEGSGGDLGSLLRGISEQANSSGADPDALRALMRAGRKGQGK